MGSMSMSRFWERFKFLSAWFPWKYIARDILYLVKKKISCQCPTNLK